MDGWWCPRTSLTNYKTHTHTQIIKGKYINKTCSFTNITKHRSVIWLLSWPLTPRSSPPALSSAEVKPPKLNQKQGVRQKWQDGRSTAWQRNTLPRLQLKPWSSSIIIHVPPSISRWKQTPLSPNTHCVNTGFTHTYQISIFSLGQILVLTFLLREREMVKTEEPCPPLQVILNVTSY